MILNLDGDAKGTEILIGEIVSAVGIKGQVKVKSYTETPGNFSDFGTLILGTKEVRIHSARAQGNMVTVKLEGIDSRDQAEGLVGEKLFIHESQLAELPEDTFYVRDLIGLEVRNAKDGNRVGDITDVIQNGPQDIYVISLDEGKSAMVPAVKEFIKEVNVEEGYMSIQFIDGMLP